MCNLSEGRNGLRQKLWSLVFLLSGGVQVVELEDAGDELDSIQQEIQMLQAFDCPQLTKYHGSFVVGR